ncbi:hypothetical protein IFR09_11200 [Pseudomonas syringae]|nr:hypothetical protein [Pseudomonas syringae]MBD8801919.1 hypothetical protein [Pseudomonas syringae]MBD8811731.1 hypothetical protein [Pseudomonas syringae]
MQIVAIDGQQTPSSLALSASEISTDFWAGLIPGSGQQAAWTMVLTATSLASVLTTGKKMTHQVECSSLMASYWLKKQPNQWPFGNWPSSRQSGSLLGQSVAEVTS